MSMFDAELTVLTPTLGVSNPTPEEQDQGAVAQIELGLVSGIVFPIANPVTGEPIVVPVGRFRFSFGREQAIELFKKGLEAAEGLPEKAVPSGKLLVANSMAQVEQAAQNIKRVSGQ